VLAKLGARNIVERCLGVGANETLVVVHHKADGLVELVRQAVTAIGARMESLSGRSLASGGEAAARQALDGILAGGGPAMWLSAPGLPTWVAHMTKERANHHRCRHLHIPQADPRMFEQSLRAEPDVIAGINERVIDVLRSSKSVSVTSPVGTSLEIRLDQRFPLVALSGRPEPGETHWMPAGQVYTHPSDISGTFVADRAIIISGAAKDSKVSRSHPARFEIVRGFVRSATTDLPEEQAAIDAYLGSDPHARRVASVIVPTNYLVRAEIGHRGQDGLLPGLNVNLGFADHATRAPYSTRVQMCLYGRNATLVADAGTLVAGGRFTHLVVSGDEPFR
jgi:leucyl aminopeptidase (aminopeptidase T)